jgi:hypothetical protein
MLISDEWPDQRRSALCESPQMTNQPRASDGCGVVKEFLFGGYTLALPGELSKTMQRQRQGTEIHDGGFSRAIGAGKLHRSIQSAVNRHIGTNSVFKRAEPLLFSCLVYLAHLLALSTLFVVGSATAEDHEDWRTVCEVPDMELAGIHSGIRTPPDTSLARAGQAWLRHGDDYAILTMPGCNTRDVKMPDAARPVSMRFVSARGYVLGSWDNQTGLTSWWVGNGSLRSMRGPSDSPTSGAPILSTDGHWVAWIEARPGNPRSRHVVIRSLGDDQERVVDLPPSEWSLLDADMERQELTFFEHNIVNRYAGLVVLGLDGARRGQPLIAEGVEPQGSTFLRVGSGWVAWDATRDGTFEPFRITWSVSGGRGSQKTRAGRTITAVAVNPAGTYIAVSETNGTRIHYLKDVVYVLRASDGKKVWHRILSMFARSSLAFLGDELFAYTEVNGSGSTVRVLQIAD